MWGTLALEGLLCDTCNCQKWFHSECVGVCDGTYQRLINSSFDWSCPQCEILHFNDSYFDRSTDDITSDSDNETDYEPRHSNTKKKIRVLLINFQSLKNKAADLEALIDLYSPDIIQGTETWLSSAIQTSEVIPECYTTYRKDRTTDSHGGVLFAKNLTATVRSSGIRSKSKVEDHYC